MFVGISGMVQDLQNVIAQLLAAVENLQQGMARLAKVQQEQTLAMTQLADQLKEL